MDKRQQIMQHALVLFAENGFEGTSLGQIAKRASTHKQLITHHFGTKEKLWREIVNHELKDGVDLLETVKMTAALEGPEAGLRQFIAEYIEWVAKKKSIQRLIFFDSQADSPRFRWFTQKHTIPSHAVIVDLIEQAQKIGVVHAGNPGRLYFMFSNMITSLVLGALQFEIYTGRPPYHSDEIDHLKSMVFIVLGMKDSVADRGAAA